MTALAVVATCIGGTFAYCFAWAYVFMRLKWHLSQQGTYDPGVPAFFAAVCMPLGLALLVMYSLKVVDGKGLPPAHVRRAERERQRVEAERDQLAEIDRIQREIDDIKRKDARPISKDVT